MTKNPGTFGPNNSPISKIIYSAIASWDGFVYQGCCGLCVVLEQILEDREQVETQFLNLDEYDDFAILDKDKNILSFHQVKCYKSGKNFEKDMALMEDKRKWWELKNLCKADAKLYFHSNMELNCYHNVEQYEYTIGEKALSPTGVVELIGTLIGKILEQKRWPGNVDTKRDALISLLDKHIALEDNELKKVRGNSSQSPNKNSIPVANIIDILQKSEVKPSVEDRVRTISFYLNLNLLQRIEDECDGADTSKVERFLENLNKLQKSEKANLIKRIFPHFDVFNMNSNIGDMTNQEVANYLYNILTKTEEMNLDKFHWKTRGQLYSPSTLGKSCSAKMYCGKIVKNRALLPPELLRDYRWIVGDINETIEDIIKSACTINRISDEDYKNISKSHKVGLLTIEDKNNGNI